MAIDTSTAVDAALERWKGKAWKRRRREADTTPLYPIFLSVANLHPRVLEVKLNDLQGQLESRSEDILRIQESSMASRKALAEKTKGEWWDRVG